MRYPARECRDFLSVESAGRAGQSETVRVSSYVNNLAASYDHRLQLELESKHVGMVVCCIKSIEWVLLRKYCLRLWLTSSL